MDYADSPCAVCAKDHYGRPRRNDSREIGHGRVVSLEVLERYVSDELPQEDGGEGEDQHCIDEVVLDFIGQFCRLDIRSQFLIEQRALYGRPLEEIAADYQKRFGRPMTAAGVSATVAAAKSRIASALVPVPTTSAPPTAAPVPGTSSSAGRKSVNHQRPPQRPQAPV